jgi:hypothetical protein
MRGKGITYDTGFISAGETTHEPFDPQVIKREMCIIRNDLHGNTVHITGGHPDRLEIAASHAADVGLKVWFSPFTNDLTTDELLDLLADCAERAERLRKRGTEVVFVTGAELVQQRVPARRHSQRAARAPDAAASATRAAGRGPCSHERLPRQGRDARSRAFRREDQLRLAPIRWLAGEQEPHPSSRSEVPLNDIAETGGSASRPLRKIVSLRREQDRRSFFRALMLCAESEQRSSCGA